MRRDGRDRRDDERKELATFNPQKGSAIQLKFKYLFILMMVINQPNGVGNRGIGWSQNYLKYQV